MRPATNHSANRTGIATSPALAAELLEATKDTVPSAAGDAHGMADLRTEYAKRVGPAGSVPPAEAPLPVGGKKPGRQKTAAKAGKAVQGANASVLVDKIGERLAFERSGVRLYDALIAKLDAFASWPGGPTRDDLEEMRAQELQHFLLLKHAMEELGGDPTAITPSANAHAVLSHGLPALLADPRTDLHQGIEAIAVAELVDNDCWENLAALTRALGQEDLAAQMDDAIEDEQEHLRRVRQWLKSALGREATGNERALIARAAPQRPARGRTVKREARAANQRPRKGGSRQTSRPSRGKGSKSSARANRSGRP
jgi:rubrerythrin